MHKNFLFALFYIQIFGHLAKYCFLCTSKTVINMKRTILFLLTAMITLSVAAQSKSDKNSLYHSYFTFSRYGLSSVEYTIYEKNGKTYLKRYLGFSGALSPVMSHDDVPDNARMVDMPLNDGQINKIKQLIKSRNVGALCQACKAEEAANAPKIKQLLDDMYVEKIVTARGDTIYKKKPQRMGYYQDAKWGMTIDWPGVATGIDAKGVYQGTGSGLEIGGNLPHDARKAYTGAISDIQEYLYELANDYKKKHIYENELYRYNYGERGTLRRLLPNGNEEREGGWYIDLGYDDDGIYLTGENAEGKKQTIHVGEEVMRNVEKMVEKGELENLRPKSSYDIVLGNCSNCVERWVFVGLSTMGSVDANDEATRGIVKPAKAAKKFKKAMAEVENINRYLCSLLSIFPQKSK